MTTKYNKEDEDDNTLKEGGGGGQKLGKIIIKCTMPKL
jgi:hypothetical protein